MTNLAVTSDPKPSPLATFLEKYSSWEEALKEFMLQFSDSEEAMRAYVRQFETWDFPDGEWIGDLVYHIPFRHMVLCYFHVQAPAEHKGQRIRLVCTAGENFRPSPDSCNMAKQTDGSFLIRTKRVENGRDLWVSAQKVG